MPSPRYAGMVLHLRCKAPQVETQQDYKYKQEEADRSVRSASSNITVPSYAASVCPEPDSETTSRMYHSINPRGPPSDAAYGCASPRKLKRVDPTPYC